MHDDASTLRRVLGTAPPSRQRRLPAEPGSNDQPKWSPGKFPLTLVPVPAFNGDLWMISQTHAFSSPDGLAWTQQDKANWGERISQSYAFFQDRLWMFGGLDYASKQPLNDIWSSSDGVQWQQVGVADWPPRKGAAVVVLRGQLWLFGGTSEVDAQFNAVRTLNDVWRSDDGVHWTQVTAAAPWTGRDGPAVLVHADALYLVGGQGEADVWRSADGVTWTQLSSGAPWGGGRKGYGSEAFGGKLWVFGGFVGASTNCLNDVWSSVDGASWTRQTEHAPWGPRSPRSVVFRDRLWIFSGKHTGGDDNWGGDIWVMRPALKKAGVAGVPLQFVSKAPASPRPDDTF
jgi:N-acetylneuraminic acid mutarotase